MDEQAVDAAATLGLSDGEMPALYRAADSTSLAGQRSFLKAARFRLVALIVAAACGVFVGKMGPPDWVGMAAVAAFLVALIVELYLFIQKPEGAWYEGRAVAESVKTLAWRYAVRGAPLGSDEEDVDDLLLGRLKDILTDLDDVTLVAGPEGGEQITPAMRSLRATDLQIRRNAYRVGRIEDQGAWYSRKASWNAERAKALHIVALGLEGGGILVGVLTVIGTITVDVLGVGAAGVAAVAAWLQTKQHETLARSYSVTAQELAAVRSDWEAERAEAEWAKFVDEAEEAVSREHTLWRASRGVKARWERRQRNQPLPRT